MEEENKKILEEIINDPIQVETVLMAIDLRVKTPYPHNIYSYFLTGQCNVYSLILLEVFDGYAIPYDNNKHVVTKIGDNYYDVEGLANRKVEESDFKPTNKVFLLEPIMTGVGNYTEGVDDKLVEEGVEAGKECLKRIIENTKSKSEQSGFKM